MLTVRTAVHVDTEKGTQYEIAILMVDSADNVPARMASPWFIMAKIVPTTMATLLLRIKISFVNVNFIVAKIILLFEAIVFRVDWFVILTEDKRILQASTVSLDYQPVTFAVKFCC